MESKGVTSPVTAWSYSRWALYEFCPLKFKRKHIDKIAEPDSKPLIDGRSRHQGVANYLLDKAPLPDSEKRHAAFLLEVKAFPDKLVEHQQGFTAHWEPTGWFGKDTWYRQVYDVALLYEDLSAEALDWKTGKRYAANMEQMELQALSLMCQFKPAKSVTTRLFYLDEAEPTTPADMAEFPASDRDKLKQKWEDKARPMLSDTVFAPRPNDKCKFCHYRQSNTGLCKFG